MDDGPAAERSRLAGERARSGGRGHLLLVTAYDIPSYREPITSSARRAPVDFHDVAERMPARDGKASKAKSSRSRRSRARETAGRALIALARKQQVDLITTSPARARVDPGRANVRSSRTRRPSVRRNNGTAESQ